jgi:hypothetical protein
MSIFYLPLFKSITKKIPGLKNIGGGGHFLPIAAAPSYAYVSN